NGDFQEQEGTVQEWNFSSETVNDKNIAELCNNFHAKHDGWSSHIVERTATTIVISIIPIIMVDSLDDNLSLEDQSSLNTYKEQIEQYIQVHESQLQPFPLETSPDDNELVVYTYSLGGADRNPEIDSFIKELTTQGINYQIEYEYSREDNVGATGGGYELILYIASAVASGMMYDLLKKVTELVFTNVKKDKIDKIKNKMAYYLNTQPENLTIIQLNQEGEKGYVYTTIRFNRDDYEVVFDKKGNISRCKKPSV